MSQMPRGRSGFTRDRDSPDHLKTMLTPSVKPAHGMQATAVDRMSVQAPCEGQCFFVGTRAGPGLKARMTMSSKNRVSKAAPAVPGAKKSSMQDWNLRLVGAQRLGFALWVLV